MLIKHPRLLAIIPMTVKSAAILAVTSISLSMPAHGYELMQKKYTVKFKLSELHAPDGLEAVYGKLQKRAANACKSGPGFSDDGTRLSTAECASDLLNQFVKTADVAELKAYHERVLSAQ